MSALRIVLILMLASMFTGCGYNTLQCAGRAGEIRVVGGVEPVPAACGSGTDLVNTVKGAVQSEKDILDSVVQARLQGHVHPGHARVDQ